MMAANTIAEHFQMDVSDNVNPTIVEKLSVLFEISEPGGNFSDGVTIKSRKHIKPIIRKNTVAASPLTSEMNPRTASRNIMVPTPTETPTNAPALPRRSLCHCMMTIRQRR
mmetsp:Transcript_16433/g.32131  ORF Transcript_16433/g.32131 Transcript_16433/m.32131 type:complete len:111 (+) Transcript_16433:924-1256(+)